MSGTAAGVIFLALLILALAAVHVPLGDYMYRVYSAQKHSRAEKFIYRLIGADPESEQTWKTYARSVLAFSAVSVVFLFVLQLVQDKLPLHLHDPATKMTPALAWNTAISFVTNTNWQAYSGESTMGHLAQMAGLAVQNFVSAAVGMAVAVALVRGFARHRTHELGNRSARGLEHVGTQLTFEPGAPMHARVPAREAVDTIANGHEWWGARGVVEVDVRDPASVEQRGHLVDADDLGSGQRRRTGEERRGGGGGRGVQQRVHGRTIRRPRKRPANRPAGIGTAWP